MLLRHLLHNSMLVAACLMLVLSLPALAQRPGGGSPPPGGMPGAGGPGAGGIPATPVANNGAPEAPRADVPSISSTQQGSTPMSTMRGGLQLGPPGRWWDDKHFAKTLHLRPAQQKRMDAIFEENRSTLVSRYQALQQEESKMEALSHGQTLDEATLFTQIDRVSQARTDLEKATTHYMLQVRKEMDADQIARLDKYR
jgi:Spy/CpxP family protein refolding chaperone